MDILTRTIVYLTITISGASVMIFELVAPRLFAPYFGTSTYIWTIVIGVVMTSLSLGYFLGGKLADRRPHTSTLATLYLIGAVISFIICLSKDFILHSSYLDQRDIIAGSFQVALLLLGPINLVLGMVTPVGVRLLTKSKDSSGSVSGNVYAVSTIGSIIGTFAAGFWLIPMFGISDILFGVTAALFICASLLIPSLFKKASLIIFLIFASIFYSNNNPNKIFASYYEKYFNVKLVADFQTEYSRIWIYDKIYPNGIKKRTLTDSESDLYLDKPIAFTMERNLSYYSFFNLGKVYNPNIQNALMIGGGAYTYARYLQETYPNLNLDVVEIDPKLLAVSTKYFGFVPNDNFHNYPMDGRQYLNVNQKKYDVIYLDAYRNGSSTPFQLLTKEAMSLYSNSLSDNGLLFINVISSLSGPSHDLLISEYQTALSIFPAVKVFPVFNLDPKSTQNMVILAQKNKDFPINVVGLNNLNPAVANMGQYIHKDLILTDDHAPVEYYDLKSIL